MFSQVALRMSRAALADSPYRRPLESLHAEAPAFRVGHAHRPLRRRRTVHESPSLLARAFVRLAALVPEPAYPAQVPCTRPSDTTLALG